MNMLKLISQRSVISAPKCVRSIMTQPEGSTWMPKKRISRPAMDRLRALHAEDPEEHTYEKLADSFQISHEAVRRILKSRFRPAPAVAQRQEHNRFRAMGERQKSFRADPVQQPKKKKNDASSRRRGAAESDSR
ncbi:hypothetical protein BCR43DRAFT_491228 [Syncephalastrum racemosum]|uniref:Required for respiratory growth protein 9, mitochondrial n=1 Tax=Syncephalastrum racemosum TaxID=13706 RepID=A0A1X2HCX9_SYNRA|nr:hypothetical protein BCR43DRAFT_491228 [Syncephalastrum racemosum]